MSTIGITEKGDASINTTWKPWVSEGKPAILITKSPSKLYQHLFANILNRKNVIVHCTITGFGGTVLEPNVASPSTELESAKQILDILGPERTVLRIDPIIPTKKGVGTAQSIMVAGIKAGFTRIRISFLDNSPHVKERFKQVGLPSLHYNFHAPLIQRRIILAKLEKRAGFSLEVCGEPGLACIGCISKKDLDALGITSTATETGKQRPTCACLAMKKELLSNKKQCKFNCLSCYWRG